jgi:hypothetical protein
MRSRSVLGWILSVLGVVLLAGAAVLHWAVVPAVAKLPSDLNKSSNYDGTAKVLVNPAALGPGGAANPISTNVPVTASRQVQVLASTGSAAEVSDKRTLNTAAGQPIGSTTHTYAVDRKSLEATDNHPSDWNVEPHQGIIISFPIGTNKQDYSGWVSDTQSTVPLTYTREETINGINTYVFQENLKATPIKDKQVLATLPPSIPLNLLGSLPIPDQVKSSLQQVLPSLGNPVDLTYTYSVNATYWVEPTTGRIVQVQREEIRDAGLAKLPSAPGIPVYDVTTHTNAASVTDAVNDAKHDKNAIDGLGNTLPIVLAAVGVVVLAVGILILVMARRRPLPPVSPGPTSTAQP